MIQRRTLLKSASLILPAVAAGRIMMPRKAKALYGVQAVKLNGVSDIAQNDGTILGFPSGGAQDLFAKYSYVDANSIPLNHAVFCQGTPITTGTNPALLIGHLSGTKKNTAYLNFYLTDTTLSGGRGLTYRSAPGSLPVGDGKWHTVQIQANTSSLFARAYLDGAPMKSFLPYGGPFSPFTIPFNKTASGQQLRWVVGSYPDNNHGAYYNGSLAEIYLIAGAAVDVTNQYVRNAFTDPVTKLPVRNSADGTIQVRDGNGAILQTLKAQIYLSGGPSTFLKNFPGWTWPTFDEFLNGTPGTMFSGTDTGPSSFYGSPFQEANSDPWGFTGET